LPFISKKMLQDWNSYLFLYWFSPTISSLKHWN